MRRTALFFSLLFSAAASAQAPRPVPDTIAQRVTACTACHGSATQPPAPEAAGERRYYPRIAGKPAGYLYNQLTNFRDGRRQYPLMSWMVTTCRTTTCTRSPAISRPSTAGAGAGARGLPAAELERGRQLVTRGDTALKVPACIACHGERLTGALPAIPGLLGLPRDYINAQFGAWRNGTRRAHAPDCMATIAGRLSLATWRRSRPGWRAKRRRRPDPGRLRSGALCRCLRQRAGGAAMKRAS
jgi:cytochrome c553